MFSYADPAALIDDPRVLRVAITDNGEPLIDLRTIAALEVDQTRAQVQQLSDNPFRARAEVAERLTQAQEGLPAGCTGGSAMNAARFVNYPAEWWHWSYGDRYWAFQAGCGTAFYGSL